MSAHNSPTVSRGASVDASFSSGDAVRTQIIDAADTLFYNRGIQSVGMDALREASGVSLKKLYSIFPSKEDIVLAVLAHRHEMWTTGVTAKTAAENSPTDRLLAIYDYLADWFADDSFRGCGFINAFGELGATSTPVAELARAHKITFQNFVAELVRDAGAAPQLGPQLAILAEGAQTTAAIAGNSDAAGQARGAAEILIAAATREARTP